MKRIAIFILLSLTAFAGDLFADDLLPLPEFTFDASGFEAADFPLPDYEPQLPVVEASAYLWAEKPSPAGVAAFDPVARASDLWTLEPDPRPYEAFSPFALMPTLLAFTFNGEYGVPDAPMDFVPIAVYVQETSVVSDASANAAVDEVVLRGLLNNEHYRESIRLKKLAVDAFDYGDYDASAKYAAEAAAAARRSDEYVALRLLIRAVDEALGKAKERLAWAESVGAAKSYAGRFVAAKKAYDDAVAARAGERYELALELARKVLSELASVKEAPPLPKQYKVRPWAETRDCFWNIAGYPWVYGDPTKWKVLYQANKSKLRRPNNPDLLHVGTVLTIPSIRGEHREGLWDPSVVYTPLSER
jgi:nucleoid-associated protein YgaU